MNKKGFSLVECLVAVLLISAMGIIVVQLLHRNTLNMLWNREVRRAAALADMVLEKYEYLSSVNFQNLDQFNQVKAPANAFFSTGHNMQGYEGMTITTTAELPGVDGTRKVTIVIQWGAGAPNQTYKVVKQLAPGSGTEGGAPIYIYVTDPSGNGVPGFEVRAQHHFNPAYTNALGTNEVIGYTDTNGYVVLNNVSTAEANQPMRIYARRPGSSAEIPKISSQYLLGYYVPPNQTWNTKFLTIQQTAVNTVRYRMSDSDFLPLGSISGTMQTLGRAHSRDMNLRLTGHATQGNMIVLNGTWNLLTTENSGHYEFNNLLPATQLIDVRGIVGSDPRVQDTNFASFIQGFSGYGGNGSAPWKYVIPVPAAPLHNIENYLLRARPVGSVDITVKDHLGNLLSGTTVSFIWPTVSYDSRTRTENSFADANGRVKLFNLFAIDDQPTNFRASIGSTGCPDSGYYVDNFIRNCSANQINAFDLTLTPGLTIEGTLTDDNGIPLGDFDIALPRLNWTPALAITQSDGRFKVCGTRPMSYVSWPNVTFMYSDRGTHRLSATFQGKLEDADFVGTQRARNIPLMPSGPNQYLHNVSCASDPNPLSSTSHAIVSDGNGNYGPICAYFPIQGSVDRVVNLTLPYTYDAGVIAVSTTTIFASVAMDSSTYYTTPVANFYITQGQNVTRDLYLRLSAQSISGELREAGTGTPLQGITFDPCEDCVIPGACPLTTDAAGRFGPAPACVSGRGGGNHGTVKVPIPSGVIAVNTATVYDAATQTAPVANPATPPTPIPVNVNLTPSGGGM
jgi:hypothetical protein